MAMVEQDLNPSPKRQKSHEPSNRNLVDTDGDVTDFNETDIE